MNPKERKYPCPAPFSQLYVLPRTRLDMRFCSYHEPVYVDDPSALYSGGSTKLNEFFNKNRELERRRKEYLAGNFLKGAGCSESCYWYSKWKKTGHGFSADEFVNEGGMYEVKKLWLSIGPDCNIFCRYCLDPDEFHIDYKTCDLGVMELAREFVAEGGSILLTGGEPFLPKFKLTEVLQQLTDRGQVSGEFEIHTNGMFLNPRVRELILRGPVRSVDVSMDTLRKDLFEYLRKGAKFDTVWGNVRSLKLERDAQGLGHPRVMILCAVMTDTYDHIIETAERVVEAGLIISFNALFKAYYSPDFSGSHGLHNLSLGQLKKLYEDVIFLEEKYGSDGPVQIMGFKGQVENLMNARQRGKLGIQVKLGGGGEAPRKATIGQLLKRGQYRNASREFLRKCRNRLIRARVIG